MSGSLLRPSGARDAPAAVASDAAEGGWSTVAPRVRGRGTVVAADALGRIPVASAVRPGPGPVAPLAHRPAQAARAPSGPAAPLSLGPAATPPAARPAPAAERDPLAFGPPPPGCRQWLDGGPGRVTDEVTRLRLAGQVDGARALAYAGVRRFAKDGHLWAQLLQLCRGQLAAVVALRAQMVRVDVPFDAYHDHASIDAAAQAGDAELARRFFDDAYDAGRALGPHAYNALMLAYVRGGRPQLAFEVWDQLWDDGVEADAGTTAQLASAARASGRRDLLARVVASLEAGELWAEGPAFNAVATAARELDDLPALERAFAAARAAGVAPSAAMHNVCIDLHARRGDAAAAERAFAALLATGGAPTAVSFVGLLNAHRVAGDAPALEATLGRLARHGLSPQAQHYSAALLGCGEAGDGERVRRLWARVRDGHVSLDAQGFAAVLTALGAVGAEGEAWGAYRVLRGRGLRPNDVVLNVLVDALHRRRLGAEGEVLLGEMRRLRLVGGEQAYTLLVDLFGRTERLAVVPAVFAAMAEAGVQAPAATYTAVVAACGAVGDLSTVRAALAAEQAAGQAPCPRTVIAVCHAYHRAGRRDPARYAEGAALVRGLPLEPSSLPDVADLLRKARARAEARALCARTMAALPATDPAYHHAWMVDVYCRGKGDAAARTALRAPPFGPESPQWVRFLCATVFWDAVQGPVPALQEALRAARAEPRNEGSLEDIGQALRALGRRGRAA